MHGSGSAVGGNPRPRTWSTLRQMLKSCASVDHFDGRAGKRVTLTGQGEIQFPVRGAGGRALMSAIDESGNCLVEYRSVQAKRGAFWYHSTSDVAIDPNTLTTPQLIVGRSVCDVLAELLSKRWGRVIALASATGFRAVFSLE